MILKAARQRGRQAGGGPRVADLLTGPAANRRVHRQRAEVDAIAVGSGTILADDPLLTARGAYRGRPLTRVIFDGGCGRRRPPGCSRRSRAGPVIIVRTEVSCADKRPDRRRRGLSAAGARVLALQADDIADALRALRGQRCDDLVLEGGATLHRAALDAGVVDAVHLYIAPALLGPGGVDWIGGGRRRGML